MGNNRVKIAHDLSEHLLRQLRYAHESLTALSGLLALHLVSLLPDALCAKPTVCLCVDKTLFFYG